MAVALVRKPFVRPSLFNDHERKNLAMLELIRKQGPIAKTDVSRLTGFNIVTVSNYAEDYAKRGIVIESGYDVSTGGRRPLLIDLNKEAGYAIGVGLTLLHISGVLINLKGEIICEVKRERPVQTGSVLIENLISATSELIERSNVDTSKIQGIGVGVPGVIDKLSRNVYLRGAAGELEVLMSTSFEETIESRFGIPVLLENDADAALFAERWLGLRQEVQNMLYMYSGVSCGIMLNGNIYRGTTETAGEIGIFNPNEKGADASRRESIDLGCWVNDLGMIDAAKEEFNKGVHSKIFEKENYDPSKISAGAIIEAAFEKDELALRLLEQAAVHFGKKIAFLVNLLNPEIVVIGGGIEQAGSTFMNQVKRTVEAWAVDVMTSNLKIIPAQFGENAVCLGSAGLVLQEVFARA